MHRIRFDPIPGGEGQIDSACVAKGRINPAGEWQVLSEPPAYRAVEGPQDRPSPDPPRLAGDLPARQQTSHHHGSPTQLFPEVFRRDIQGRTKLVQPQPLSNFVTGEGVAYRDLRHYLDNPKYILPALEQVIKASDFTGLKTFVEGVQIPPASHWDTDATDESVS